MNTTLQDLGVTSGDVYLLISYLITAVFFVLGLKLMSHPETARKGNFWAAGGMGLAMVATLFLYRTPEEHAIPAINVMVILAAIAVGGVLGAVIARKVTMTAMPQLVSFFNRGWGFGAGCPDGIFQPGQRIGSCYLARAGYRRHCFQRQHDMVTGARLSYVLLAAGTDLRHHVRDAYRRG